MNLLHSTIVLGISRLHAASLGSHIGGVLVDGVMDLVKCNAATGLSTVAAYLGDRATRQ